MGRTFRSTAQKAADGPADSDDLKRFHEYSVHVRSGRAFPDDALFKRAHWEMSAWGAPHRHGSWCPGPSCFRNQ